MSKLKNVPPVRPIPAKPASKPPAAKPDVKSHATRETIESIVIAFVLAFLFRTFEAEAFVIPTGSMAPTLMGRHKDVECPKCGKRYQVNASEEESDDPGRMTSDIVAGMCPTCRYVMPMQANLPLGVPERNLGKIPKQSSYNGDRILVNKYIYAFTDPQRWDVVVFKFPGDAKVNYIKRLVGLPGETIRIFQGDLFIGGEGATQDNEFKTAQKPASKVLAMRQLVHDTEYDPAELDAEGWPLRWSSGEDGWKTEKAVEGEIVRQRFSVDRTGGGEAWLRYRHMVPDYNVWQQVVAGQQGLAADIRSSARPRLITDANPYNARLDRAHARNNLEIDWTRQGLHWVGDLMVEADVAVEAAQGEMVLDLVEGGRHFTCTIDLPTGQATLSAAGDQSFAPTAKTPVVGPGEYRVAFANVDDQLLLWVDGDLISFEGGTAYDAKQVFGDRRELLPVTSEEDPGDLAPVGIGARGAKLAVDRLQVWRDLYYIAVKSGDRNPSELIADYDRVDYSNLIALPGDSTLWPLLRNRRHQDFPLGADQFFVMGDNSAESSDARLWRSDVGRGGQPGGDYLERRLLIGKALCVYWPHSWNRIPGTPIPFPLFPNVADMRLVR
jgi:signal peptidase I